MKKLTKALAVALAVFIAVPSVPGFSRQVMADSKYNITLNGVQLQTQNPVQNINDRILLPFRDIGEAMGAQLEWDDAAKKITAYRGNRYSVMIVGNTMVTYGTFTISGNGSKTFTSETSAFLPVAPTIINSYTYIPVRSIAETLGGEVEWDAATNTAIINSSAVEEPTSQTNTNTNTNDVYQGLRPLNYGDFSKTDYFKIKSSSNIKEMYNDSKNNPFIFVLYDSSTDSSKTIVPSIQVAASDIKTTVYGLDRNDSDNKDSDLDWLWDDFFSKKDFTDPTVYFVHSKTKVTRTQAPNNMIDLKNEISSFASSSNSGSSDGYGDFKDTSYFKTKKPSFIQDEYADDREFILFLYDSTDSNSKEIISYVKEAAKSKSTDIYGIDMNDYPKFYNDVKFIRDADFDYERSSNIPALFLVYKKASDLEIIKQPNSTTKVKNAIEKFKDNSGSGSGSSSSKNFSTISSTGIYKDISIKDLKSERFQESKDFIVLVYDSSDNSASKDDVEFIVDIINDYYSRTNFFFGINVADISSSNYKSEHSWLFDKVGQNSYPALLYYHDGECMEILNNADDKDYIKKLIDRYI